MTKSSPVYVVRATVAKHDGIEQDATAAIQMDNYNRVDLLTRCAGPDEKYAAVMVGTRITHFKKVVNPYRKYDARLPEYIWRPANGKVVRKLWQKEYEEKLILDLAQVK